MAEGVRRHNEITEAFLQTLKAGDLVDVRIKLGNWTGPHKLVKFEIDPPKGGMKPAARIEIDLGAEKKLERWLIVGDQKVIRKHIPEEQKQRPRVKHGK